MENACAENTFGGYIRTEKKISECIRRMPKKAVSKRVVEQDTTCQDPAKAYLHTPLKLRRSERAASLPWMVQSLGFGFHSRSYSLSSDTGKDVAPETVRTVRLSTGLLALGRCIALSPLACLLVGDDARAIAEHGGWQLESVKRTFGFLGMHKKRMQSAGCA